VAKEDPLHREHDPASKSRDGITSAGVRWQDFLVCAFLVLIVLAVFGQTGGFGFTNYDDDQYVYQNPVVENGLTLKGAAWAMTYGAIGHWHPLTWITHMADCQMYGLWAGGPHWTNVALHAVTAAAIR
jgi:nitrate reductase NapE component